METIRGKVSKADRHVIFEEDARVKTFRCDSDETRKKGDTMEVYFPTLLKYKRANDGLSCAEAIDCLDEPSVLRKELKRNHDGGHVMIKYDNNKSEVESLYNGTISVTVIKVKCKN